MPDPDNDRQENCDSLTAAVVIGAQCKRQQLIHAYDAYARQELLPKTTSASSLLLIFINFQIGHEPYYLSFILGVFLEPVISDYSNVGCVEWTHCSRSLLPAHLSGGCLFSIDQ
jgi:hypothetical protein